MKRRIALIFCIIVSAVALAQFDPQIGQFMYFQSAVNPAAVGADDLMRVSGLHRMSFVGFKNAPMSTFFSFGSAFNIGKTHHGAGVRFLNDRYGLFSTQTLHAQYAYRQKLGNGYLSVGADLGFVNVAFKGDSVNLDDLTQMGSTYHEQNDQAVPMSKKNGMGFDLGVGIYYTCPSFWVGANYSHLSFPKIHWDEKTDMKLRGTLYLMGGYVWRLKNKNWHLLPSAMVMTDFAAWDVDLVFQAELKERFRFGMSYRVASSVGVLLSVDIITGLTLGYTYELSTSKLLLESYGSHEIYLSYGFNVIKPKRNSKYKSIRFM